MASIDARAREEWEAKREEMVTHHELHGRLLTWYEDTVWVRTQRADYAAGTMSEERRALLEALPFWKWETESDVFVADLTEHYKKHGRMPQTGSGAKWLKKKQKHYSRGMSEENKRKVEALGGPVAAAIMSLCPPPSVGAPCAQLPQLEVKAAMSHEWEKSLLKASAFHLKNERMPKYGEKGYDWLNKQQRDYSRKMPKELKQRVKDEGGAVAAFIMNVRQTPSPGG